MQSKKLVPIFAYALLTLGLATGTASANCADANYGWSATVPPVNVRHVFCGEIRKGAPKGYHSKIYAPATDVVTGTQNPTAPVNGIYNGRVNFLQALHKMSTFFPDACSQPQIVASIVYASQHAIPVLPWGQAGPSAPAAGGAQYCLGANGNPFPIRHALLANGRVNTAFPG